MGTTDVVTKSYMRQNDVFADACNYLIYDALQYGKQVDETSRRNRRGQGKKPCNSAEYLSGFYKEDKLIPVITFVIHFGADEWDGPMSIKEMMNLQDETLLEYIQDYKIHLIDPAKLTEEDLGKFRSSLREMLSRVKYSKDDTKMEKFIKNNRKIHDMDILSAQVVKSVGKLPVKIEEEMGKVNMWKAIDDMMKQRELKGKKTILIELVEKGTLSVKDAAEMLSITEKDFKQSMKEIIQE